PTCARSCSTATSSFMSTERSTHLTRRELLARAGSGLGTRPVLDLLARDGRIAPGRTHHPPRANAVIWLFMYGGPSAIDLFDPKPELDRMDGRKPPAGIDTFFPDNGNLMRSPYTFARHGESGQWVASPFPALARVVDRLAFLKSVHCASNKPRTGPAPPQHRPPARRLPERRGVAELRARQRERRPARVRRHARLARRADRRAAELGRGLP